MADRMPVTWLMSPTIDRKWPASKRSGCKPANYSWSWGKSAQVELQLRKGAVNAVLGFDQFRVCARFHDFAFFDHKDAIGVSYRSQAGAAAGGSASYQQAVMGWLNVF